MDALLAFSSLHQYAYRAAAWLRDVLLIPDTLWQLGCILLLALATLPTARPRRCCADKCPGGALSSTPSPTCC